MLPALCEGHQIAKAVNVDGFSLQYLLERREKQRGD